MDWGDSLVGTCLLDILVSRVGSFTADLVAVVRKAQPSKTALVRFSPKNTKRRNVR